MPSHSKDTMEQLKRSFRVVVEEASENDWLEGHVDEAFVEIAEDYAQREREAAVRGELQYLLDNYRQFHWDGPNGAAPTANILAERLAKWGTHE